MESTLKNIFMIILAGELLMGILGNGFIVLVNCIDWIRSWKFSLIDFILTCLASSRIFLLCIIILGIALDVNFEEIWYNNNNLLRSLEILWTGSNYFCMISTTCLCVFYFLKIANFSNSIFFWMKWRIHKILLIIVLGATLSFCLCILFKDTLVRSLIKYQVNAERNFTCNFIERKYDLLTPQKLINIMFIIPFLVSLASLVLLILSLWSHARQMEDTGSRDPSREAHVRAMKSMISFLLLFFIYYLSHIIINSANTTLNTFVAKIFAHVLLYLYPSGHPFLLILWNSKLKQASLSVLKKLKSCMNLRKPTIP
uniref:Taste receptor type 2 n=1 Tax=Equus caballus TaxID=9796 RepID=A0A3Q2HNL2_HORSE